MKLISILVLILGLIGCSVKTDQSEEASTKKITEHLRADIDSDGDLVNNKQEVEIGRDPFIAELPELRVNFLQNYKIKVDYIDLETSEESSFIIDTSIRHDDPDFKYRVGEIFLKYESFKNAANIGKFSSHSWGEVVPRDLTWVKYPDVDTKFHFEKVLKYKKFFDPDKYEIKNIQVVLENSVRLKSNSTYREVSNLSLNFYYYNYETENYEQLKTEKVERHFQSGVNESFEVVIDNVPASLLVENYFKRGEFIISELGNYEIPKLKIDYKRLLTSVKSKSLPVVYNTPLSTKTHYVGVNGSSIKFSEVMRRLYDDKFTLRDNKLIKVLQFENNLPEFTYLSELKEHTKKGKWFVFTNNLKSHFLEHDFSPKDTVSLSYITGNVLARQAGEKITAYRENAQSSDGSEIYPLGNIVPNSEIHVQIKPKRLWGEKVKHWKDTIYSPGGSCGRNCMRREFYCDTKFNIFSKLDEELKFQTDYSGILKRVKVLLNDEEFDLATLILEQKIKATWIEGSLHLEIEDISKIKELNDYDENVLILKLNQFKETTYNGVYVYEMRGRHHYTCPMVITNIAGSNKWPLSVRSKKFGEWQGTVNWSRVQKGHDKTYTQDFSVGMSSIVINHFN